MRKRVVVVSTISILVLVALWFGRSLWNDPRVIIAVNERFSTAKDKSVYIPEELKVSFNQTINTPTFKVIEAMGGANLFKMEYAFPVQREGEQVVSELVCEEGANLQLSGDTAPKKTDLKKIIPMITPENGPVIRIFGPIIPASFVRAVFMSLMVNAMGSMSGGATAGVLLWLGFVAPSSLTNKLFADRVEEAKLTRT